MTRIEAEQHELLNEERFVKNLNYLGRGFLPFIISLMFFTSGCVATQDWVQTWVNEQLFPINKRVSDTEANVTQMGGRVTNVRARLPTSTLGSTPWQNRLPIWKTG